MEKIKRNLTKKLIDPYQLKENALEAIPVDIEEIIDGIKRIETHTLLDYRIFYRATIHQLILGKEPNRWMLAVLTYKSIFRKKENRIDFYSETLDIKITFNEQLKLDSFEKPKERDLLIEKEADEGETFYTKRRVEKRLRKTLTLKEFEIMKNALIIILNKNEFIQKPGTIQGFFCIF